MTFVANDPCFQNGTAAEGVVVMPSNDEPPDWFIELWLTASDGDASEEDLHRLNNLIVNNESARNDLFELAQLHAWLDWLRTRMEH